MNEYLLVLQITNKYIVYYSDTSTFIIEVVLYLFTFLHCKCIFFIKIVVILNKTITFALYHYDTRNK